MRDKDVRPNTYRRSREAVKRLNREKNYNDWIEVADGFIEAREEAHEKLGITGSNRPTHRLGGGYNKAFGEILQREKLGTDVVDSATRNQLFEIKDNISAIEAFRSELAPHERGKLNHPSTVLRHWKAWQREADKKNGQPTDNQSKRLSAAKRTSDELALALETIEQQNAYITELEAARETGSDDQRIKELKEELQLKDKRIDQMLKSGKPPTGDTSTVIGALTTMLAAGRLDHATVVAAGFDRLDLIELAKDLTDIADKLKRQGKKAAKDATAKATAGEGDGRERTQIES